MNREILEIIKNPKAREGLFSFFVLLIMFCVNVPIILKEAFSKNVSTMDISPILSIWFDVKGEIRIPIYQYTLLFMYLEALVIIHGSKLVLALIDIGKKLAYKFFGLKENVNEANNG